MLIIRNSDGSNTLHIDNAAAWENNALVNDCLCEVPRAKVDYQPTRVAVDAQTATEATLWYERRRKEYELVKRLYTRDERTAYKQLCVFAKRDNLHKRLVAVVMYTPRGNVWLDVTTGYKVVPRGSLGYRKVSNDIARQLLDADDSVRVYMQSFKEVLHEQSHRMQDKRRYHAAMKSAPRDRRVGEYIQKANYGQRKAEAQEIAQTLEDAYLYRKWG